MLLILTICQYISKKKKKKTLQCYGWSLVTCKMNCEKMKIYNKLIENSIPIQPLTSSHMEILHTIVVASPLTNHYPFLHAYFLNLSSNPLGPYVHSGVCAHLSSFL